MKVFPFLTVLLLLFPFILPPVPRTFAAPSEWTHYRHDVQHSGRASEALQLGSDGKLHLQWAYSLGERVEVEVEPIVAAGKIFVGAMNGTITALNASDGSVAWAFTADGPIAHTAAYADGLVFFGSIDGSVYALYADGVRAGTLKWKFQTGAPVYAAPIVANGSVYIGSTSGRFFALDANSSNAAGAAHWSYPAQGQNPLSTAFTGAAALSPDGSRVYVGNEDLKARALDATNGALVWANPTQLTGVGMRSTYPIVSDDGSVVIFVTAKPGTQSYLPTENYPGVSPTSDPVTTWNTFYQTYPERRATFFLRASDGQELWDKT